MMMLKPLLRAILFLFTVSVISGCHNQRVKTSDPAAAAKKLSFDGSGAGRLSG